MTVSVWDAMAMWTRISGTQYSAVGNAAGRAAEMDPVGSRISGTHARINLLFYLRQEVDGGSAETVGVARLHGANEFCMGEI